MIVRFIADMLDKVQCRRIRRKAKALTFRLKEQRFQASFTIGPFCHTQQKRVLFVPGNVQLSKNGFRLPQLTFPAIDQYDVRNLTFFNRLTVAPTENLIHCRIIITRRNTRDVIAAILGAQWSIGIEYHAGGYRLLAHRVADIKALHAFHCG